MPGHWGGMYRQNAMTGEKGGGQVLRSISVNEGSPVPAVTVMTHELLHAAYATSPKAAAAPLGEASLPPAQYAEKIARRFLPNPEEFVNPYLAEGVSSSEAWQEAAVEAMAQNMRQRFFKQLMQDAFGENVTYSPKVR